LVEVKTALRKAFLDNWRLLVLSASSMGAFLLFWWLYAAWLHADWPFSGASSGSARYVPYPWVVFGAFLGSFTIPDPAMNLLMTDHILASLKRMFLGFILAFGLALPLGLLMGRVRSAEAFANPIVELFRPIPPLAWVPIVMIVFASTTGSALIVFLGIFFPVLLNVRLGAKSVDPLLIDASRTLGAKGYQIFASVIFPSTIPYMMTGIKMGLGIGWMCIVAAEMFGVAGGGVGRYIFVTSQLGRYDLMFAGIVVIGILSVLTTGVAGLIERWVFKWMGLK
jgi:ABC-type nitrate/sulfonate/bicarbonate transport system permease component